MSAAALTTSKSTSVEVTNTNVQSTRETIESVVVAFILAFLFRAFVAEAFVIPTGSMAPTLMGAHKDIVCEHCGQEYQASASLEFDSHTGRLTDKVMIASTCSTCRGINAYDFRNNPNHATFSGDRILVSKFDYVLSKPRRWDVLVFKYPTEARMNYIKRLVGLPGETLQIREGDIYTRRSAADPWTIARKPPHKIRAMRQIVSDTDHLAPLLIEQGWPSLWQPWNAEGDAAGWNVQQTAEDWSAELASQPDVQWLRYYHKFVDERLWQGLLDGQQLPAVDPTSSQLITDYLAYNSSYRTSRNAVYQSAGRELREEISGNVRALDLARRERRHIIHGAGPTNDSYHWVGDLVSQFDIDVQSDGGTLLLNLVEFGMNYQCSINVASGVAELRAVSGGQDQAVFDGSSLLTAETSIRGSGSYRVELANIDDQIVLWVNGKVADFSQPATYDSREFRSQADRRPHWTPEDPLDAAPVGIGGQNVALQVKRARVYRDIYYIAVKGAVQSFNDFILPRNYRTTIPDAAARSRVQSDQHAISMVYAHPQWWSQTDLFQLRRSVEFELDEGQYFPMGDNSAASSDARAWPRHHYVEQRYLLGKALLVFWPHTWNTPVPFTPNFSRMGRIR